MHDFTIRKAIINDIPQLVKLRIEFLTELKVPAEERNLSQLELLTTEYFEDKLRTGEFVCWLAEIENKIISTAGMVLWQWPPGFKIVSGKRAYIMNVYTLKEFRGNKISQKLINTLIQDARKLGIENLHLHTSSEIAEYIYKKIGFKEFYAPEFELNLEYHG